jgi:TolA-binding protein
MKTRVFGVALLVSALSLQAAFAQTHPEVIYSPIELKKLDTFEAFCLTKADKIFAAKDYRRAAAEYDSFILEFPKSKAIPYALLRKGRCLQVGKKRYEAIKEYREVLDYFPNAVKYAAASLYYTGESHWANGDEQKAMKTWAEMAQDVDYSKMRLAASAILRLADELNRQEKRPAAVKYWRQVALDFRTVEGAVPDAYQALLRVIPHYVRAEMNEPELRKFYNEVQGFHSSANPDYVKNPETGDRDYWYYVMGYIGTNGSFTDLQRDIKDRYYQYWTTQMDGKYPEWDAFHIARANYIRRYEGDQLKWAQRLDAQFKQGFKPGNYDRITEWITLFAAHRAKVDEYFAKYDFTKMSNAEIDAVMRKMYGPVGNKDLGRSVFNRLKLNELNDPQLITLETFFWPYKEEGLVTQVCALISDKERGKMEVLRYYRYQHDTQKGLPLADVMIKVPTYANESVLIKAQLLHMVAKYADAIACYTQYDPASPTTTLYPIAECYRSLGRLNQGIAQLREVENFFKPHASEAALKIADYYNSAGIKQKYVASLFAVMDRYPRSSQSSVAHDSLEKLGYRTGGALKKAD